MKPALPLFRDLMRTAPFQPATNLWRAVEIDAVQKHGLPGGLGLDLGCGDGKLTRIVDAACSGPPRRWIGVDMDPEETRLAVEGGLYDRVHTCSAATIPEPDAAFDFVFSNSVLEHIPPIEEVLAEAARLLRVGGRFIATVPGPGFHEALRGPRLFRANRQAYLRDVDRRCAHLRYWGEAEWRAAFARHGMELQQLRGYLDPRQTGRWESLSNATGGLLYRLSGGASRPIEIQRRFGMRSSQPGVTGRLGAALSGLLATGCSLEAGAMADTASSACLLVDAVRR